MLCERCLAMAFTFRKPSTACQITDFDLSGYRGALRSASSQCPLYPRKRTSEPARVLPSAHELRQLGDIGRNPPRLIFRQQLGRRSPAEDRTARPLPESSRTNADDWLPTGSLGRV